MQRQLFQLAAGLGIFRCFIRGIMLMVLREFVSTMPTNSTMAVWP
jgi:hypothetical protein